MSDHCIVSINLFQSTYETFDGVEVLMYQPASPQGALRRGLVYFHGGGWVTGSAGIYQAPIWKVLSLLSGLAYVVHVSLPYSSVLMTHAL